MARPRKESVKPTKKSPFAKWLDEGLRVPGKSNTKLAAILSIDQSRVSEMRNDKRDPQAEELKPISEYLGKPLPPGFVPKDTKQTHVVGYVGAGAETHYYSDADSPGETVPTPVGASAQTVAVEIRGTSLGLFFDRWLVYYEDEKRGPSPDMYRRLCIVWLENDKVLIKRVLPGTKKGFYHLQSLTEGIIEDQVIRAWAEVTAMTPR